MEWSWPSKARNTKQRTTHKSKVHTQKYTLSIHTLCNPTGVLMCIMSKLIVVSGAEVNATVIGENDPVDEVQGFLFGKLK